MRFLFIVIVVPVAVQIPVTMPVLAPLPVIAAPNNPEMVLLVMVCVPLVPMKIPPTIEEFADVFGCGIFCMLEMVLLVMVDPPEEAIDMASIFPDVPKNSTLEMLLPEIVTGFELEVVIKPVADPCLIPLIVLLLTDVVGAAATVIAVTPATPRMLRKLLLLMFLVVLLVPVVLINVIVPRLVTMESLAEDPPNVLLVMVTVIGLDAWKIPVIDPPAVVANEFMLRMVFPEMMPLFATDVLVIALIVAAPPTTVFNAVIWLSAMRKLAFNALAVVFPIPAVRIPSNVYAPAPV